MSARTTWFDPTPLGVYATAARNALGFDAYQTWALRRAEQQAFYATPYRLRTGAQASMSHVRTLPPRAAGGERLSLLARALVSDLTPSLRRLAPCRAAVALALPERMGDDRHAAYGAKARARFTRERAEVLDAVVGAVIEAGLSVVSTTSEARGHAGLAHVLADAGRALEQGRVDVVVAGGLDTYLDPDVVDLLLDQARIFDGENLDSFVPGEGGAMLLFARPELARAASLSLMGRVEGVAVAREPAPLVGSAPTVATGLTAAARALTQRLSANGRRLDLWIADVTHEDYRIHEWQLAHPRAAAGVMTHEGRWDFLPVYLGDLGAATLPTAVAIALEAFRREPSPGDTCLVTGSSEGPDRGAVLVTAARGRGSDRVVA